MQNPSIRVLLINESNAEYVRISHILSAINARRYQLTWCGELEHALEAMLSNLHDVILLDYCPNEGQRLLNTAVQQGCLAPIIVVTDKMDNELDQAAIKAGASDYLIKSEIGSALLERSIRYALDRKESELELARLAHYDALSGVPNRVLFRDRLERAIQRAERGQQGVALLFLDFDGFKKVNDTYGHDAGDKLIELIAERLSACMRKTDSVARLGGDEFTVVLEDVNSTADIINVAKKIIQIVAKPFPIFGNQIVVGCSTGIAQYPEAGTDFETMLKHADMAMYQAKQVRGSAYRFYTDRMNAEAMSHQHMEDDLRRAMRGNELQLYFQPRVNLQTRKITGVEGLLRWQHPARGMLEPSEFLDVAEETGLIVQLGYWVIHQACQAMRELDDLGFPALKVAVNVSTKQLQEATFCDTLRQIIAENDIDARRLEFELNETALMDRVEGLAEVLAAVHTLGPGFALDDFGTGFSSFPHLQSLPITTVKIDHSLVQQLKGAEKQQAGESSGNDAARVITAMIQLAKSLELLVVAEGADAVEQVRFLKQQGCDQMQGYYFSPAVPFDAFCQLLNAKVLLAV
ncbi:MAG: two-component system response regulator [Pseudomonadales bacterium]